VLSALPDYSFGNEAEGNYVTGIDEGGTHGYLNTDPKMQAIFVAWGAGIASGVRLGKISNLDVAPTIAAILGIEMKTAKGHALREILKPTVHE
jgi:predicted AlkP superfamily pyrophosphatase or phosphodiesterase